MNRNQLSRAARSLGRIFCIVTAPVVLTGCEPSYFSFDVQNATDESIEGARIINGEVLRLLPTPPGVTQATYPGPCFDFGRFDITIEVESLDGSRSLRHSYVQRCGEFVRWAVRKNDLGEFYLEMVEPE